MLRVVLLASGSGADEQKYKPDRDDSQWWSRRDALVRCVAAFLFCSTNQRKHRELVLWFEDDSSRLHMTYDESQSLISNCLIPTEREVISLWKEAAKSGCPVERNGLSCRLELSVGASPRTPDHSTRKQLESKRDVLNYLQETCSLEFLRSNGLNSSPEVLLRKVNKKALMSILHKWEKPNVSMVRDKKTSHNVIRRTFQDLLRHPSGMHSVIASILHESNDNELPCWGLSEDISESLNSTTMVCLFLGAVRDMTHTENRCLREVCQERSVPLTAVRLSPVPEFTSKILSIVALHDAYDSLLPSMQRMINDKQEIRQKRKLPSYAQPVSLQNLHWVYFVPMASSGLKIDLNQRDIIHWNLVRTVVTTLWRSRLASLHTSNNGQGTIINRLSLIFSDGNMLEFHQDELVKHMAEQHQAAPSEYQILRAIQAKLTSEKRRKEASLFSSFQPHCLLSFTESAGVDIVRKFYDLSSWDKITVAEPSSVMVLLSAARSRSKEVLHQAKEQGIPIFSVTRSQLLSGVDAQATTICMVQHLCYQNALRPILHAWGYERKKKSKKSKTQR